MPTTYRVTDAPQVGGIQEMATRIKARLDKLEGGGTSIKDVKLVGNVLKFYDATTDTATAAVVREIDLPAEMFIDAVHTNIVQNFSFSTATYPGATNPNLDGKTVFVLAVKTVSNDGLTTTTDYSFVDASSLVDTYTASDTTILVSGYKLKVRVSAAANNAITVKNDGLHVDISGKVDKVTGATAGNFAVFDSDGGIVDSTRRFATDTEFNAMLDELFPTTSGGGA